MSGKIRIYGDDDANTITGTGKPEYIYGLGGDDLIDGGRGNDHLDGGAGADTLLGGDGDDEINGGDPLPRGSDPGGDRLEGGAGADQVSGDGADTLLGGDGNDQVYGSSASGGLLDGGDGVDQLNLWLDSDTAFNGDLSALENGGELDLAGVTVRGFEFGTVQLGRGNDSATAATGYGLDGGGGDDLLIGTRGADAMDGGSGADTLIGRGGDDRLSAGDLSLVKAGGGDDTVDVFGDSTVLGGAGDDRLSDETGGTILIGGDGDDTLSAFNGGDLLKGGAGRDLLQFGIGPTTMDGGANADVYQVDGRLIYAGRLASQTYEVHDRSIGALDLSQIDADTTTINSNDAFHIVERLTGQAGELAVSYSAKHDVTTVQGDLDGDGVADLLFRLQGDQTDPAEYVL